MEYLIDSADLVKIRRLYEIFPIVGVTTNPLILSRCNIDVRSAIKGIREIIGNDMLHVQVLSDEPNGILEQAEKIVKLAGDNTFVKVPVTPNGIQAMQVLSKKGFKVTATAIFTPQQAILAAQAGVNYVAPYVNRLDNISTNGVEIAANINNMLAVSGTKCKVLAASFSNVEQVHMTMLNGVNCLTISPELYDKMLYHPLTKSAVEEFIAAGKPYYNI